MPELKDFFKMNPDGSMYIEVNGNRIDFEIMQEAPENPEIGKNYKISPEGLVGGFGAKVYGAARKGSENKLMVVFLGGGVALNEHMAIRPFSVNGRDDEGGFWSDDCGATTDIIMNVGLLAKTDANPFRDWSVIFLPYNTGDFHTGTGDLETIDLDGNPRTVHFHGYTNYRAIAEQAKRIFKFEPEEVLVTGCSGGAFGTALLTGDVLELFPTAKKCYCVPDSAIMRLPENQEVARGLWKAPEHIWRNMTGDEFVLPPMLNLKKKYGERVQLLFVSSIRDAALASYVGQDINYHNCHATKEQCDGLQEEFKGFLRTLLENDPSAGAYFFDAPDYQYVPDNDEIIHATQHTILLSFSAFTIRTEGKTVLEWLYHAVNGKAEVIGKALLEV